MTISKKPRYNLNLIIQETGLKADTIRAWERRYKLPLPARSEGGHRLYSDYDLATLKWLVSRQKEGMRISQAVDFWKDLVNSGDDPLQQDKPPTRQADTLIQVEGEIDTLADLRHKYLEYCLQFDESHAEQVLSLAFAQFPLDTVLTSIILPSLNKVGQLWYQGEATVQQEHFTAEIAIKKIEALITAAPNPVHAERILVASAPGEQHTIILLSLTLLLRQRGWDVVYLGANVPNDQMTSVLDDINPALAILTSSRLPTTAELLSTLNILADKGIPAVYGGWIFDHVPELTQVMPGIFLGNNLPEAIRKIEELIRNPQKTGDIKPYPPQNQDLVKRLLAIRPDLDLALMPNLHSGRLTFNSAEIYEANLQLVQDLSAALRLGDISFLKLNMDWISGLIKNRKLDPHELGTYLNAFSDAVDVHLGDEAKMITTYIRSQIRSRQR